MNSSVVSVFTNHTSSIDRSRPNWHLFVVTEIFSIVYLSFLAVATTLANGFTLYAIYKDPLKCFRTPLTIFITAVISSDFLTGLIVEPVLAAIYSIGYIHRDLEVDSYMTILRTAQIVSMVTINTSFFTILALAIAQMLALGWPGIYDKFITNQTAKICIFFIWVYSLLFAMLPEITKIPLYTYYTVDLILNTTLVTLALIVLYIVTYAMFRAKVKRLAADNTLQQPSEKVGKDFLFGTFILTIVLIITVWPFTIALYVWIFKPFVDIAALVNDYIALVICENILLVKFLWDPIIFFLRVPKYRKAMVLVYSGITRKCGCVEAGGGVVVYNLQVNEERREEEYQDVTVVEEGETKEKAEV